MLEVECGDMRVVLATLPENSFDSCVCDPPYELGFMGKKWDNTGIAFDADAWRAVYRVLKPGSFIVAFGGTRTWHRIACGIEDAGFEIRQSAAWLFGQGMPKSQKVERAVACVTCKLPGRHFVGKTPKGSKAKPGDHTCPPTPESIKHEGRGSALKPCFEPIIIARKPMIGTMGENALKFGTGGLNIDLARIPHASAADLEAHAAGVKAIKQRGGVMANSWKNDSDLSGASDVTDAGRWPPDVICDEDVAADLDETNGEHVSQKYKGGPKQKRGQIFDFEEVTSGGYNDSGGVSRYFYCPKSNSGERDAGLRLWPPVSAAEATDSEDGQARLSNGRTGAGRTSSGQDEEELEVWAGADRLAVLRVAMGASHPTVIGGSTMPDKDATEWSTLLFGSNIAEPSLKACKCTIEMKTSSTTDSRILNYLGLSLISDSIVDASLRTAYNTSPVANADVPIPSLTIIVGATASLPGVGNVASGTPLKISVVGKGKHARRCFHPTVKPLALMRWLCRLVTPHGGFILDPFAGSGTTGCAAALEGFHFAGVELDPVHVRLATDRIAHWARSISVARV